MAGEELGTSGVILAGGHSLRLGLDKRRLRLWGEDGPTLLEHSVAVLQPICVEVIVVLNDAPEWRHLPARLVGDTHPGAGALGGIYAGLAAATCPAVLVVAADMPLLNACLLRAMRDYPHTGDVLLPRAPYPGKTRNRWQVEPLHARYSHACLGSLQAALQAGTRRIIDALAGLHIVDFPAEQVARCDPAGHSFLNINTPADLEHARRVLRGSA